MTIIIIISISILVLLFQIPVFDAFSAVPLKIRGTTRRHCAQQQQKDEEASYGNSNLQGTSFNPFKQQRPSKSDLYSNDELLTLFNLHQDLSNNSAFQQAPENDNTAAATDIPSIHDVVLQFLNQEQKEENEIPKTAITAAKDEIIVLSPDIQQRLLNIRAIACDVDGTLLTSNHQLHPRTAAALLHILQHVLLDPNCQLEYLFLATGKTKTGALHRMPLVLQTLFQNCPGVYSQGLYCVDRQQHVIFEQTLSVQAVQAAELFATTHQLTLLGYSANQIFATASSHEDHIADIHAKYGEPEPILQDTFHNIVLNKLIVMGHDNLLLQQAIRPLWDQLAVQYNCTTTQAVPLMLELLPPASNKAVGVRQLCLHLGINPETELLAAGDGENDKELLEMASIGIAVGNAVAVTRAAADLVLTATNNDGAVGMALEQLFGVPKRGQ